MEAQATQRKAASHWGGVNTKLLETVGGVGGIVDISRAVARGEMTEAAGENVLIEIYGLPRETAAKLVEVPKDVIDRSVKGDT